MRRIGGSLRTGRLYVCRCCMKCCSGRDWKSERR
jgi:hypothetical protein